METTISDMTADGIRTHRTLSSGARIPIIGIGTYGSDRYDSHEVSKAVRGAITAGYRLIDCAAVYGNEPEVGAALADALEGACHGRRCS